MICWSALWQISNKGHYYQHWFSRSHMALVRMSTGDHAQINIKPTDMIILSSSPIPGNEEAIFGWWMICSAWAWVIHNEQQVSRDMFTTDQEMYRRVKPKYLCHRRLPSLVATRKWFEGNAKKDYYTEDKMWWRLMSESAVSPKRVPVGAVMVDGLVEDIGNIVLRDRQAMAQESLFLLSWLDKRSARHGLPDISRGFVYERGGSFDSGRRSEIKNIVNRHGRPRRWKTKTFVRYRWHLTKAHADQYHSVVIEV